MTESIQTSTYTHTHTQCSLTSVGLTQTHANKGFSNWLSTNEMCETSIASVDTRYSTCAYHNHMFIHIMVYTIVQAS